VHPTPNASVSNLQTGARVALLGLAINVVLATVKIFVGVIGNAYVLIADGIESALEQARRVAGDKDVEFVGGATVANEYLEAGLIDAMDLSVAPILLGGGARMFDGVGDALGQFALERTIAEPKVTHYRFVRR